MANGHCDCGERCSCPPGSEARARCTCWHEGEAKPVKVFGLIAFEKTQKPLIEKHCFGDCGKVSMAGVIEDELVGPLWVCCEERCPWLLKQMEGEPYGTTMSFGRPHEIYLRTLADTPAAGVLGTVPADERAAFEAHIQRTFDTPELGPFNAEKFFYRVENGRYFKGWLQSQWEGWQARAADGVKADERLHTFLNAAAGEGLVLDGVDAADLYIAVFPERYRATIASIEGDAPGVTVAPHQPNGHQPPMPSPLGEG